MTLTISKDLTVDSVTLAAGCDIEHKSALQLLRDHAATMEECFGVLRFENAKPGKLGGRPSKVAFLTEDQATFFVTLCNNTEPVIRFKAALVKAFSEAKSRLAPKAEVTDADVERYLDRKLIRFMQPKHDHGTLTKDGRERVGFRAPTFTASRGRLSDARQVATIIAAKQDLLPGLSIS